MTPAEETEAGGGGGGGDTVLSAVWGRRVGVGGGRPALEERWPAGRSICHGTDVPVTEAEGAITPPIPPRLFFFFFSPVQVKWEMLGETVLTLFSKK